MSKTIESWYGIVSIQMGAAGIVGVKYNDTLRYVSSDIYYDNGDSYNDHSSLKEELESWHNIVYVSTASSTGKRTYAIGLRKDGTAISTGKGEYYTTEPLTYNSTYFKDVYHTGGTYNDVSTWKLW